jgi:hypothetical protein
MKFCKERAVAISTISRRDEAAILDLAGQLRRLFMSSISRVDKLECIKCHLSTIHIYFLNY